MTKHTRIRAYLIYKDMTMRKEIWKDSNIDKEELDRHVRDIMNIC